MDREFKDTEYEISAIKKKNKKFTETTIGGIEEDIIFGYAMLGAELIREGIMKFEDIDEAIKPMILVSINKK